MVWHDDFGGLRKERGSGEIFSKQIGSCERFALRIAAKIVICKVDPKEKTEGCKSKWFKWGLSLKQLCFERFRQCVKRFLKASNPTISHQMIISLQLRCLPILTQCIFDGHNCFRIYFSYNYCRSTIANDEGGNCSLDITSGACMFGLA